MMVSEKQIMQLIELARLLACDMTIDISMNFREEIVSLLREITHQQSEELKEIE